MDFYNVKSPLWSLSLSFDQKELKLELTTEATPPHSTLNPTTVRVYTLESQFLFAFFEDSFRRLTQQENYVHANDRATLKT